ncbi:MAG: outer membrane lipoprotein carrier protein LolA [Acidobacteria bacterium]|nr:MAG: outer membrane lipoprotein carrier protein LolA [Acidobacteriota bacterium]
MMRRLGLLPVVLVGWCLLLPSLRGQSSSLDQILSRMDQKGATLRSMSCQITQKKWTEILEEFDKGESGRFYFLKKSGKVYLRKDITQPQENSLIISDGKVTFYQPRIKQAQQYNLGQNKDKAEFLLLGFGSDKQALKNTYTIRLLGQETIRGSECHILELTPKSERVSAFFPQIVLWVDSQLSVPVRQKLVEPTRDYLLIDFEGIQLNAPVADSLFQVKLPKDVKVVGS